MAKKKKKTSHSPHPLETASSPQAKQDFKGEKEAFESEKEAFYHDMTQREEALAQNLQRIKAIDQDVTAYITQLKEEKLALLDAELQEVHKAENQRILEDQEMQREKLALEWTKQGERMDEQMRERLKRTEESIQEREEEFAKKEKKFRKKCIELQSNQEKQLEEEHQRQLAFQEKEAVLTRTLEAKSQQLDFEKEDLILEQGLLQGKISRLQEEKIRAEQNFQQQLTDYQRHLLTTEEKYAQSRKQCQDLDYKLREFHQELGVDLQSHQNKMEELTRRNRELEEALSLSVPRSVEEEFQKVRTQFNDLLAEKSQWEGSVVKCQTLELSHQDMAHQLALSQGEVRFHTSENQQILVENTNLKEKINELTLRYCSPSALNEDYSRRVAQITDGYNLSAPEESFPEDMEELDWLAYIMEQCRTAQMEFPLRIFLAFHTALKISDWSIVTVLAGVSGTGKSKLPELYATFGGLNFLSVPVQEHWDGQEAMLGYFNTMDNRFEPQPLLRFLLSAIEVPPHRRGILEQKYTSDMSDSKRQYLEDSERTVSLVLLDEMNLAHVEEYFAEFLSKLEGRRGLRDVPAIDIKLGTGMGDFPLKLQRNILWTGTMNQDETTKSLSDKVLDRGIVINFPRPDVFLRRESQRIQGSGEYRMPYKLWRKWLTRDTSYNVTVEDVGVVTNYQAKWEMIGAPPEESAQSWTNYKAIIETINRLMTQENRALGHRVWQSTEYFVVNHPMVIYEMNHSYDPTAQECILTPSLKTAIQLVMEDQLVQKILPKLRGVDYYEDGTLAEIGRLIGKHFPNIRDDYQRSCTQGQGQFMWATSSYAEDGMNSALHQWFYTVTSSQPDATTSE